jgi:hypothetical protein
VENAHCGTRVRGVNIAAHGEHINAKGAVMSDRASHEMFNRLLSADGQTRAAKTIEVFGWICLAEAIVIMLGPGFVAAVLHLPALSEQAANYFRLASLLTGGIGMLTS